jgi:hypothetical protein
MQHGICFACQRNVLLLHVVADGALGLAFFSIAVTTAIFAAKRRDLPCRWLFTLFEVSLVACGATHLLAIWTIWQPYYWLEGAVKAPGASSKSKMRASNARASRYRRRSTAWVTA